MATSLSSSPQPRNVLGDRSYVAFCEHPFTLLALFVVMAEVSTNCFVPEWLEGPFFLNAFGAALGGILTAIEDHLPARGARRLLVNEAQQTYLAVFTSFPFVVAHSATRLDPGAGVTGGDGSSATATTPTLAATTSGRGSALLWGSGTVYVIGTILGSALFHRAVHIVTAWALSGASGAALRCSRRWRRSDLTLFVATAALTVFGVILAEHAGIFSGSDPFDRAMRRYTVDTDKLEYSTGTVLIIGLAFAILGTLAGNAIESAVDNISSAGTNSTTDVKVTRDEKMKKQGGGTGAVEGGGAVARKILAAVVRSLRRAQVDVQVLTTNAASVAVVLGASYYFETHPLPSGEGVQRISQIALAKLLTSFAGAASGWSGLTACIAERIRKGRYVAAMANIGANAVLGCLSMWLLAEISAVHV